jgi:hypothetical protein
VEKILEKSTNLGYLIENIKKQNKSKPKIIGPQLTRHQNKLTVVLEID